MLLEGIQRPLASARDEPELRIAAGQAVMAMVESGRFNRTSINDFSRRINPFLR
jgi:hypothetical protein